MIDISLYENVFKLQCIDSCMKCCIQYLGIIALVLIIIFPGISLASSTNNILTIGWVTSSPYQSLSTYNPNIFTGGLGGFTYGLDYAYTEILNVTGGYAIPAIVENYTFSPSNWVEEYNNLSYVNITFYLRNNSGWGNGDPVTAYDIYATCLLLNMFYNIPPFPKFYIINNYTITISYPKKYISPAIMPETLYSTVDLGGVALIINYQVWKPIIQKLQIYYNEVVNGSVKICSIRNEIHTIVHSFNPSTVAPVSANYNGPFYVSNILPNEIILKKNPYYYAANSIPWNEVILYQYSSLSALLAALKSGQIDLLYTGATSPPADVLSQLPSCYKIISVPNPGGYGLYFNFKNPWLRMVQVRQAIAYVLNRTSIAIAGGLSKYSPVKYPDGICNFTYLQQYLSPIASQLNSYSTNLNKAAELLESVGFKKINGEWYTPNGSQFTLHIVDVCSQSTGVLNMLNTIVDELDAFGIHSDYTVSLNVLQNHKMYSTGTGYDIVFQSWGGYMPGTVDWYLQLQYLNGYPFNVTQWDGIVTLPNGVSYNMTKLYFQAASPSSHSEAVKVNDEIAKALNYYLPELPLVKRAYVIVYNDNAVKAPPSDSWFWDEALVGVGGTGFLQVGFSDNYLQSVTTTTVTTTTSSSLLLISGIGIIVVIIIIILAILFLRRKR